MQGFLWMKYDKKDKINIMLPPILNILTRPNLIEHFMNAYPIMVSMSILWKLEVSYLMGQQKTATQDYCYKFFQKQHLGPYFLSLFSVKGIIEKDLVKVILKHYLNHLNETKFAVVL